MRRALVLALALLGSPAFAQAYKMPGVPDPMAVYTVSTLPTSGVSTGAVVYVTDCRAVAAGLAAVARKPLALAQAVSPHSTARAFGRWPELTSRLRGDRYQRDDRSDNYIIR